MLVKAVTGTGFVDIRYLTLSNFDQAKADMASEGIDVPSRDTLKFDYNETWCINLNRVVRNILCRDESNMGYVWYHYTFERGFVWDLASVPSWARSLVGNNEQGLLDSSLVHDSNFTCHFLPFRRSNEILHDMYVLSGGPKWKGAIVKLAVSTPFGMVAYKKKVEERGPWQKKYCSFNTTRASNASVEHFILNGEYFVDHFNKG